MNDNASLALGGQRSGLGGLPQRLVQDGVVVASGGGVLKGEHMLTGFILIQPGAEMERQLALLNSIGDPAHVARYTEFEDWFKHTQDIPGQSYSISPGYWKYDDPVPAPYAAGSVNDPYLPRTPAAFAAAVQSMIASGEPWQLITSWNEWGERADLPVEV